MAQQQPPQKAQTSWRTVLRRSNDDMLFAEDLGGYGCKPVDVEIIDSGIKKVKTRGGPQDMPWLQFRGNKGPSKKLGLGRGMCKVMQTLCGTDVVENWRGWITLIVVKAKYTDEDTKEKLETDAIRIAAQRPRGRQASAPSSAPAETAPAPTNETVPELSDDDKRAIEMAEAEEARRGEPSH